MRSDRPTRTRTVTDIMAGDYGRLRLGVTRFPRGGPTGEISLSWLSRKGALSEGATLTRDELREVINVLVDLADGLDAVAAEQARYREELGVYARWAGIES